MKTRKAPRNIIEINILKQGRPSKKVLSVSFYTMKDAYRIKEKYELNLKMFLNYKKTLKGFETRIYTDDSGKDFALKAAQHDPNVSVYHFNYPPLREKNGIGHIGVFGSLVRFLPFFEHGLDIVWESDIDIYNRPYSFLNPMYISKMKSMGATFAYRNLFCYEEVNSRIYHRAYTIICNTMISTKTFPKKLFYDFLDCLVNPTPSMKTSLQLLNDQLKKRKKPTSQIPYLSDELFLNTTFYDYLIDTNVRCCVINDYNFVEYLLNTLYLLSKEDQFLVKKFNKYHTFFLFNKIKELYKEKLPQLVKHFPCVQEMIDRFDILTKNGPYVDSFIEFVPRTGKELNHRIE
jgi:hypothetical protein